MSTNSAVIAVSDDQVITDFDPGKTEHWCSPKVIGFKLCVDASATVSSNVPSVTISVTLDTPFGSVSKSFSFGKNTCFTWAPIKLTSVKFCVKDLAVTSDEVSFKLSAEFCIKIPIIGKECATVSHKFHISLGDDSAMDKLAAGTLSDEELMQAMMLGMLLDKERETHDCSCN